MDLKRTCLSAACIVAFCFTMPLGMEFYGAHRLKINRLTAAAAIVAAGDYSYRPEKQKKTLSKTLPRTVPQLLNERLSISSKTVRDIKITEETVEPEVKSHRVMTEQPSQKTLDLIKYPAKIENHDGVIQSITYPTYKGTQYINLKNGGQVRNCTDLENSVLEVQSAKKLPFAVDTDSNQPQVLIYHTHTTESYEPYARDFYDSSFSSKTTDMTKNVVSVGDKICEELDKAGISYVHDTLVHDYPDYNGAYDSSRKTVQEILKQYPSIKICLDIHRDGIQRADGTRIAPVTEIGGKQAAQIMIISGCDDGTMGMPNYLQNFIFASKFQSQIESDWNTLTRPVLFDYRHYNQDLTTGSLLIEMGGHGNSIEQAQYSGELVGKSLVKLIKAQ